MPLLTKAIKQCITFSEVKQPRIYSIGFADEAECVVRGNERLSAMVNTSLITKSLSRRKMMIEVRFLPPEAKFLNKMKDKKLKD